MDRSRRRLPPAHRVSRPDPRGDPAPELGLPAQIRRELQPGAVRVPTGGPVGQHQWTVGRVAVEQPGQAAGHRVAPSGALQVTAERGAPLLLGALVDHLEQRPHQDVGRPRVRMPGRAVDDLGDQRRRRWEAHTGADTVLAALAPPQTVGELLGEPAFDAAGRDRDHLLREGIGQRCGQELGQCRGQCVGPLGPVHEQRHGVSLSDPGDLIR